jgi:hypothetical protein
MTPLYRKLAGLLLAVENCEKTGNKVWREKHRETIKALAEKHLPRGSGFDNGTKLDLDSSEPEKLVFQTSFHHMNNAGMYTGWTEHKVTVKGSLVYGFTLTVSGQNRNDIKDFISDMFQESLNTEVE